jgi:pentapeptide MXKDX repeat protein
VGATIRSRGDTLFPHGPSGAIGLRGDRMWHDGITCGPHAERWDDTDRIRRDGMTRDRMRNGGMTRDRMRNGGMIRDRMRNGGMIRDRMRHGGMIWDRMRHGGMIWDRMRHGGMIWDRMRNGGMIRDRMRHRGMIRDRMRHIVGAKHASPLRVRCSRTLFTYVVRVRCSRTCSAYACRKHVFIPAASPSRSRGSSPSYSDDNGIVHGTETTINAGWQ